MIKKEKISFIASFLFTIILILSLFSMLIVINFFSEQKIEDELYQKDIEMILSVIDVEFDNNPILEKTKIISDIKGEELELYPIRSGDNINAVVIRVANYRGYGGYMELLVGFFMDGTISGYRVVTHNETIGLGSQITDLEFSEQFKYIHPERESLKVRKDGGEIDAVSSATISSRAVVDAISSAYQGYQRFVMGE